VTSLPGVSGAQGDDGRPDVRLAAALAGDADSPAGRAEVLAALAGARVFVALAAVATGEQDAPGGLRQEAGATMALLSLVGADGGRAVPAFTDGHEVQRWRAEARPVPVPGPQACGAVLDDGAVALLLDPHRAAFVVGTAELAALAHGRVPVSGSALSARSGEVALTDPASADPALLVALGAALEGEPVAAARLLSGPDGPVLGVVPRGPRPAPAELAALAARLVARLGTALPPGGLDLAVVTAEGPGAAVPLRRRRLLRRR
jgi:SseB protein N-terminal domain